ncbi:helix-turn-helix domain-containing protein [Streptomyces gamaensis]|uniref:Helix-turn-helix domain-containing protein n=1 Tax=Streptomyces gamaensis TaxID=1763542 RepID=A0ABW0YVQ4_9ACTN
MSEQHVGQRIRELRKIRQMSVRQLANAVAVSVSALEKYERGDRTVSPATLARLAQALKVGPTSLTGQPYLNGAEAEVQAQAVIPELRRILLTHDNPDDLTVRPRPLRVLAQEMAEVSRLRQDGAYIPMGPLLPGLLTELTHVALSTQDSAAYWWLARGYRAVNSLAHKMGYHDLSFTAIERVHWAADRSGDPLMQVTAAYLKAGAMIRMGTFTSARRVLEGLADQVSRMAPEGCLRPQDLAVLGGVQLKLAVLEARDGNSAPSRARLEEAGRIARLLGRDSDHYEMSFGPTNLRIHEVAALIDMGNEGVREALARLREWGEEQERDEWAPSESVPAERRSHHHIDVAAAKLAVGDRNGAHQEHLAARRISPVHARYHPTLRATAATLVRLGRNQDDSVAAMARWAGASTAVKG